MRMQSSKRPPKCEPTEDYSFGGGSGEGRGEGDEELPVAPSLRYLLQVGQ